MSTEEDISGANDTRVIRDFDPENQWKPDGLVTVGADGSPTAQAKTNGHSIIDGRNPAAQPIDGVSLTAADWKQQAQSLSKQSEQLANAAEWARNNGMETPASEYQLAANKAYYGGQLASMQAIDMSSKNVGNGSMPSGNTFYTNWNDGRYSAGLTYTNPDLKIADYSTIGLNKLSGNGTVATNLHSGNSFLAGGVTQTNPSSISFRTGGQMTLGWVFGAKDAASIDAFLSGDSSQTFVSMPTPWKFNLFGAITHAHGGSTALELGVATRGDLSYGVTPISHSTPITIPEKLLNKGK